MVESVPGGWWYSAALSDERCAVAFFTDSDLLHKQLGDKHQYWQQALDKAPNTLKRLSSGKACTACSIHPASSHVLKKCLGPGWLAAGDAALGLDPLSSMGIPMALLTGCHAGRVAIAANAGHSIDARAYSDEIQRQYENYRQRLSIIYQQEQRWPESDFWARRIGPAQREVA